MKKPNPIIEFLSKEATICSVYTARLIATLFYGYLPAWVLYSSGTSAGILLSKIVLVIVIPVSLVFIYIILNNLDDNRKDNEEQG